MFSYASLTFCIVLGNAIAIYLGFRKLGREVLALRHQVHQQQAMIGRLLDASHAPLPADRLDGFTMGGGVGATPLR